MHGVSPVGQNLKKRLEPHIQKGGFAFRRLICIEIQSRGGKKTNDQFAVYFPTNLGFYGSFTFVKKAN